MYHNNLKELGNNIYNLEICNMIESSSSSSSYGDIRYNSNGTISLIYYKNSKIYYRFELNPEIYYFNKNRSRIFTLRRHENDFDLIYTIIIPFRIAGGILVCNQFSNGPLRKLKYLYNLWTTSPMLYNVFLNINNNVDIYIFFGN